MEIMLAAASLGEANRYSLDNQGAHALASRLSVRTKFCIEYLHKVVGIELAGTTKDINGDDNFIVNVYINSGADSDAAAAALDFAKTRSNPRTTSFQIQRTLKEIKDLVRVVKHWANKHTGSVKPCVYCRVFQLAHLPNRLMRATMSKGKLELVLQGLLNTYVSKSRLPRPSKIECQGFDHISSVITTFLTRNLPHGDSPDEAVATVSVAVAVAAPGNDDLAEEKHP